MYISSLGLGEFTKMKTQIQKVIYAHCWGWLHAIWLNLYLKVVWIQLLNQNYKQESKSLGFSSPLNFIPLQSFSFGNFFSLLLEPLRKVSVQSFTFEQVDFPLRPGVPFCRTPSTVIQNVAKARIQIVCNT